MTCVTELIEAPGKITEVLENSQKLGQGLECVAELIEAQVGLQKCYRTHRSSSTGKTRVNTSGTVLLALRCCKVSNTWPAPCQFQHNLNMYLESSPRSGIRNLLDREEQKRPKHVGKKTRDKLKKKTEPGIPSDSNRGGGKGVDIK